MDPVMLTVSEHGVATVRMAEPEHKNAFTDGLVHSLRGALSVASEDQAVKVILLCGLPEVFCSGASRALLDRLSGGAMEPTDITLSKDILDLPVPVIAAMRGHAVGGGLVLGACADVVLLAAESRYGFTFMDLGFTPGMGATALLAHLWSPAIAHELLYTGELRRGADLAGSGVNAVLPADEVEPYAFDLAARVAEKPRLALRTLKRTLSIPRRRAFEEARTIEALMHSVTFYGPDVQSRIAGFNAQ